MTDQSASQGANWNDNPFVDNGPLYDQVERTLANRPAQNAPVATPGAALHQAQHRQSSSGALDFLGLDQELSARVQPAVAAAAVETPAVVRSDESWLLEMSEEQGLTAPAPEVDAEPAETSAPALLNTAWQEDARPSRQRKLALPLTLVGVCGSLALAGVLFMRADRPQDTGAVVRTGLESQSTGAVRSAATQVASETARTAVNEVEPSEPALAVAADSDRQTAALGASTRTPAPEIAPQVEIASASPREPASTRTAVEVPDAPESLVEIVPSFADLVTEVETPAPEPAADALREQGTEQASTAPQALAAGAQPDDASLAATSTVVHDDAEAAVEPAPLIEPELTLAAPALPDEGSDEATPLEGGSSIAPASAGEEATFTASDAADAAPVLEPTEAVEPVLSIPPDALPQPRLFGPPAPAASALVEPIALLYGPQAPSSELLAAATALPSDVPASVQSRTSQLELEQVLLLDGGANDMRRASVKEMSGVWSEPSVPFASIGAKSKVLTPAVGKVRVVLLTGEIFEGALYAVGEGCVWLDTQYGRMGLAGARVKSVAQIDAPKNTPALGSPGSQDLAGLARVRIKTPGGVLYGKVIDRNDARTTVITDDGARLTLDSHDVELLTQAPAVTIKKP